MTVKVFEQELRVDKTFSKPLIQDFKIIDLHVYLL